MPNWRSLLVSVLLLQLSRQSLIAQGREGAASGFVLESWSAAEGLPVNTITRVLQSRSGYIWLGTFDGLVRFDGVRFTTFNTGNTDGLPSNRVIDIQESGDGSLVLTTETNQQVRFQNGVVTPLNRSVKAPPARLRILPVQGPDGKTWSVVEKDIFVDGRLAYKTPLRTGNSTSITSVAVDHEGSLWFGTTASGLHQLKQALFTNYTILDATGDNNLYSVAPSRSGGVWVGGWADKVSKIENGKLTNYGPESGVPPAVISIFEESESRVWLGKRPCELPAMRCNALRPNVINGVVHAMYKDTLGTIWFGTQAGLFQLRNGIWTRPADLAGAPTKTVRAFLRTSDGALWMGTNGGGLWRYQDGVFTSVTTASGLPGDFVRSLYQDADGTLWVGTEGKGLARLDPREWPLRQGRAHIASISTRNGLFDDGIHTILEDARQRLWMSTNRGIFWVPRSELNAFADRRATRVKSTGYTERHGLRNHEANGGSQPAAAKTPDGKMWFATQDGVAMVDPAAVNRNVIRPNVLMERVVAGGTPMIGTGQMQIPPNRRDLQIEYTAPSFLAPENVRFRYRLIPYDAKWVDAGTQRSAVYTRVPPGHYTFRVIATNGEDVWNDKGATLELEVIPKFVETRSFCLLVALAIALLIWGGLRWRFARLRHVAAELQVRVDDRTRELRERETLLAEQNTQLGIQAEQLHELDRAKSRFFANVSHELRTPLTLTIGPLEDARVQLSENGGHDAVPRIDMALRNARRLFRLVNQILDVSKLEAGGTKLRARRGDLSEFVRAISSAFASVAERKAIAFEVNAPSGLPTIWFDPDALEKVIANLLSNAFKFTPDGGHIRVDVEVPENDTIARVRIADSGPGIPEEHLPHIFDRFYQVDETNTRAQPGTGIGLSLARELAELHGGSLAVESESRGATFILTLPTGASRLHVDQIVEATGGSGHLLRAADFMADGLETVISNDSQLAPTIDEAEKGEDVTTLLVVDDNADLRSYVRSRFSNRYRIVEAQDGADAIRRASESIPDLIISDVMMPGMDGHALCAAIRENPETDFIPVILLTAQAEPEQRIAGLDRGADDYIVKPFDMRELEARVENLIASRRRLRARFAGKQLKLTPATPAVSAADAEFIDRVRSAIEGSLDNPDFGVNELAGAVFQDRSHLFRRIRDTLGETPSDLLRRLRLERAAAMLDETDASIAEVAYGAGFNSVSHFCRTFRTAYGVTPSAYRTKSEAAV